MASIFLHSRVQIICDVVPSWNEFFLFRVCNNNKCACIAFGGAVRFSGGYSATGDRGYSTGTWG